MTFTPEEIAAMAKEAGMAMAENDSRLGYFTRFATLVADKAAARELEACCAPDVTNSADICAADMPHVVVQKYLAAIRARGQKGGDL